MSKRERKEKVKMQVAAHTMMVPNPLRERVPQLRVIERELTYVEDRIAAPVSYRDDPVGQMYSRGQLDHWKNGVRIKGDDLLAAARRFQSTWEAAGTPLRSSGDIREHVDGGRGVSDGITDQRMAAGKELASWRSILGRDGYSLLVALLVDKRNIRQIADAGSMMPGKAATTFTGHYARRMLSLLAKAMGFG